MFGPAAEVTVRLSEDAHLSVRRYGRMKRMGDSISVNSLHGIAVLYPEDLYDLACLLLKIHRAEELRSGHRTRTTVHGLAKHYSLLTRIDRDSILDILESRGLLLGAMVEEADEVP